MKRLDGFKKYAIIVSILFIGSHVYDGILCLVSDDWHTVPLVLCLLLPFEAIVFVIVLLIGQAMHLIKVVPLSFDYLDSDLKKDGFGSRQHLEA